MQEMDHLAAIELTRSAWVSAYFFGPVAVVVSVALLGIVHRGCYSFPTFVVKFVPHLPQMNRSCGDSSSWYPEEVRHRRSYHPGYVDHCMHALTAAIQLQTRTVFYSPWQYLRPYIETLINSNKSRREMAEFVDDPA